MLLLTPLETKETQHILFFEGSDKEHKNTGDLFKISNFEEKVFYQFKTLIIRYISPLMFTE